MTKELSETLSTDLRCSRNTNLKTDQFLQTSFSQPDVKIIIKICWESKIHLIRSQTQFKWEFYQILARVNLFQFLNL